MSFSSIRRPLAAATVLAAFVVASPAAANTDLRSPDARDAAAVATAPQDLRSADARDGRRPVAPLEVSATRMGAAESPSGSGFAWFEVGLGAAIAFALGGTALLAVSRRQAIGGLRPPALHG